MIAKVYTVTAKNFPEVREIIKEKFPNVDNIVVEKRECINTICVHRELENVRPTRIVNFLYRYDIKIVLKKDLLNCESKISSKCKGKIYSKECYYHGKRVCESCFTYLKFKEKQRQ